MREAELAREVAGRDPGAQHALGRLRVRGTHIDDRDIKVLETGLFDGGALFVRPVLGGLAEVQDRLHSVRFELGEMLGPWLPPVSLKGR